MLQAAAFAIEDYARTLAFYCFQSSPDEVNIEKECLKTCQDAERRGWTLCAREQAEDGAARKRLADLLDVQSRVRAEQEQRLDDHSDHDSHAILPS